MTRDEYLSAPADLRLQYAGAIGLLCECSLKLGSGYESDELRDCIERAAQDFCTITGWTVRRVMHRIEVEPPRLERPIDAGSGDGKP